MAEIQIPSKADITITVKRRGFQPYGTARIEREREAVREVIKNLSEDIEKHKKSIYLLQKTFGI